MYKIVCDTCDEDIFFNEILEKPEVCSNCNYSIEHLQPQKISESSETVDKLDSDSDSSKVLSGMTMIYQKTQEKLTLDPKTTILGRESHGSEILGNIPQISRNHCLVEFIENQFLISDMDSFNGTFVGISKINCKENPRQVLKNDDLVFLGKETFLVQFKYVPEESNETGDTLQSSGSQQDKKENMDDQSGNEKEVVYRCKNCGKDYDNKEDICQNSCRECNTYDEWEEIVIG